MNYESFIKDYGVLSDRLKERQSGMQTLLKRINKAAERGDLKAAAKDLAALSAAAGSCAEEAAELETFVSGFSASEFLASGAFTEQLTALCRDNDIDIAGEGANYEVFPYRLKIDAANAEVLVNGKKYAGLRPGVLVDFLRKGLDKLWSASFNTAQFADELAAAYDLVILTQGKYKTKEADVYLSSLYKCLTPMRRFRRDYDMQSYAFDLARLFGSDTRTTGDGRMFQFGPSRDNNRSIRIVDAAGTERFLATIRFYNEQ